MMTSRARTWFFLTTLLAVALVHAPALGGSFVWDDHEMIVANPDLDRLGNVPGFFRTNYFGDRANSELYRPLVNTSLALDCAVWGRRPFGYHLTNLLLHLAAGVLLWTLLRRLTDRSWLPEAAAWIFLLHPASAEPVAWIVARGDGLALCLTLATVHLHLSGRRRPWLHPLALLAWLLALFGKLAAAPAPLLILLVESTFRGLSRRDLLRPGNLLRYGTYAVPAAVYLLIRTGAMATLFPSGPGRAWGEVHGLAAVFTSAAVLFREGFLLLFPAGMCADYSADPVFRPAYLPDLALLPGVLLLAAGALAVLAAAAFARRKHPLLFFGVVWVFLSLVPVSQVIRIGTVMADRFLYLPAVGAAVALAAGLPRLRRGRILLVAVVLACFAAITVSRERVWRSDLTMNRDVLLASNYPNDPDAWDRLGLWYHRRGKAAAAEEAYREGLRRDPDHRYLLKNLGALLIEGGRLPEARKILRRALRVSSRRDLARAKIAYNLAVAWLRGGDREEAAEALEEAVLCRPPFRLAFERLIRLYREDLGRPDRAAALRARLRSFR